MGNVIILENHCTPNTFKDLEVGDIFTHNGMQFIKITSNGDLVKTNAVCLSTGTPYQIGDVASIILPKEVRITLEY